MTKFYLTTFLTLVFSINAFSQSYILKRDQNSVFFEAGVAGGEGVTAYGFGLGATYRGRLNVTLAIARATDGQDGDWGLGEALGIDILRKDLPSTTLFLSLDQSFTIAEDLRVLSFGGTFGQQIILGENECFVYSAGVEWLKPLNTDLDSEFAFPIVAAMALGEREERFYIAPGITFGSNNTVTYGVTLGFSFVQRSRADW